MTRKAPSSVRASRRLIGFASAGALGGIAMSAVAHRNDALHAVAPLLTVASLLALVVALHRLGRSGPDEASPRRRSSG